jgi:predicted XRE-type DNA-binding protein
MEIALPYKGDAFRVVYAVLIGEDIWVVHAFQKKSTQGIKTPLREMELAKDRLKRLKGDAPMSKEELELVRGSGNVFRDLNLPNPDVAQLKAIFAAEILKILDSENLTVRAAHARTGVAAADFSRIRNADLGRFTLDRLISIINRLGSRVEVTVAVHTDEPVSA